MLGDCKPEHTESVNFFFASGSIAVNMRPVWIRSNRGLPNKLTFFYKCIHALQKSK